MSNKKGIAIVAGAGPGTGASVARAFARKGYAVALLARTPSKLLDLESQITSEGGTAASFPADLTQRASLTSAFTSISEKFGADTPIKVAILNAGGHMVMKPFLECTDEELQKSTLEKLQGAFIFSQLAIEAFKKHDEGKGSTLIFSGATAALKGSAKFGLFAAGSFGLRALSQSLAREFQPQGIHVSHLVIDGMIETPRVREALLGKDISAASGHRLDPEEIAKAYVYLTEQRPSAWTQELDLRPEQEKW